MQSNDEIIKVISPKLGSIVVLDSEAVTDYFKNDTFGYGLKYFGKGELLPMNSVKFAWEAENTKYYEVYIADNVNFTGVEKYVTKTNSLTLLLAGQRTETGVWLKK